MPDLDDQDVRRTITHIIDVLAKAGQNTEAAWKAVLSEDVRAVSLLVNDEGRVILSRPSGPITQEQMTHVLAISCPVYGGGVKGDVPAPSTEVLAQHGARVLNRFVSERARRRAEAAMEAGIADALASLASLLPDRTTLESIGRLQLERDAALQRAEREQRTRAMVHAEQQRASEIVQAELGVPSRDGLAGGLRGLVARVKAGSGSFDRDDAIQFFAYLERVTKTLEQVDTILNPLL